MSLSLNPHHNVLFTGLLPRRKVAGDQDAAPAHAADTASAIYDAIGTDGFVRGPAPSSDTVATPDIDDDTQAKLNHNLHHTSIKAACKLAAQGADINFYDPEDHERHQPLLAYIACRASSNASPKLEKLFEAGADGSFLYRPRYFCPNPDYRTTPFLAFIRYWLHRIDSSYDASTRKDMPRRFETFSRCDVNSLFSRDSNGQTALHLLAKDPAGHRVLDVVAPTLISRLGGFSIDEPDHNGQTPLMSGLLEGIDNLPTIDWLLSEGAKMSAVDHHGLDGWDYASLDADVFQAMLERFPESQHPDWKPFAEKLTSRIDSLEQAHRATPESRADELKQQIKAMQAVLALVADYRKS